MFHVVLECRLGNKLKHGDRKFCRRNIFSERQFHFQKHTWIDRWLEIYGKTFKNW